MRLCENLTAPVKTVNDVVLIAHVPRIYPDPSTQLNPCEENRCHQKCDEKGPDKLRSTRRNYSETQKRSDAHSPKEKDRNSFRQVTEVFVRNCAPSNRSRVQQ